MRVLPMPLFHIDQRPAIRRCEEQLALLPSDDPWLEDSVSREIREILDDCELAPHVWSPVVVSAVKVWVRAGDHEAAHRVLSRAVPRAGRVAWARVAIVVALIIAAEPPGVAGRTRAVGSSATSTP